MAGALVTRQLPRGVGDDGDGGSLARLTTVQRPRVQVMMVIMVLSSIPGVLDIEPTLLGVAELAGAGEGVGVGGPSVTVTAVVPGGKREHSLVITRALDIQLLPRQILLLLDHLLALLLPALRDEG